MPEFHTDSGKTCKRTHIKPRVSVSPSLQLNVLQTRNTLRPGPVIPDVAISTVCADIDNTITVQRGEDERVEKTAMGAFPAIARRTAGRTVVGRSPFHEAELLVRF